MAKKKPSCDQTRQQKKQKQARRPLQLRLLGQYTPMLRRLQEIGFDDRKIIYNPPGYDKMSRY